ncbi:MAG: putative Ig domain-containing protein [Terriglobales bacterium]
MAATTGCASLNAGSTASTPSKPTQPIAIAADLPPATLGNAYSSVMSVSGGSAPYSFSIRGGKLPPGLSINAATGSISGHPMRTGNYAFVVSVLDKAHIAGGVHKFSLTVSPKPAVQIAVSPASLTIASGASHQFAAQVANTTNRGVTWWASAGKITPAGLFTAPNVNASAKIEIIATSKADLSKNAFVSVSVNAAISTASSLTLTNAALPEATEGVPYSAGLHATGGTSPYHWKIAAGSLPSGFAFDAVEGGINGVAAQNGSFPVTIQAADVAGQSVTRQFRITVSPATSSNFDGPAELPRIYVKSSLADTPAPGVTHQVKTTAALKSTLDSAKCGDTILLEAGTTFEGTVVLPAKNCDDNHWIIIRTSAPDSALPPEGTRLTPCSAGVASLPGRPAFSCSTAKNVLAKVVFSGTGSGPIVLGDGASHYRLIGLEVTRTAPKTPVYNLVVNEKGGAADHIIFDRMWLHGTAQDETTRGIMLGGDQYVAVVDSYFSDFHCVAITGACTDAQAIAGGVGDRPMGPYKIVNNYLEAAGENIIFGGGAATLAPTDIEVRGNHMFKPIRWMKGSPSFVGGRDGHPFIVKNLFELKNAQRVLLEGNILDNSWGGFSQVGFGILLTPKNQAGAAGVSVCPACLVTDVTVRYNLVRHTGAGIQIGNGVSATGGVPRDGQRYSIHDVIFEDIDGAAYSGSGLLAQVSTGLNAPLLQNVKIDHITATSALKTLFAFGDDVKVNGKMNNFTFTNSITSTGTFPFVAAHGGPEDCPYHVSKVALLNACFSNYEFSHNALIAPPSGWLPSAWPEGNFFPASPAQVQFTDAQPEKTNYVLLQSSPYKNAGSDGKDLGADVAAVTAAIAFSN